MLIRTASSIFFSALLTLLPSAQSEESASAKKNSVELFTADVFNTSGEDIQKRTGLRTEAVLILRNNKVVFEKYGRDYHKDRKHNSWSLAKSMTNAIVGHAVLTQGFDLQKSICSFGFKENCEITPKALLEMSSGLQWREDYENAADPTESDVIQMLYGKGHQDVANYVASRTKLESPMSFWRYSSGDPSLLMGALRNFLGAEKFQNFLNQFLSEGLELGRYTFEKDPAGLPMAASHLFATAQGFSKLGSLFLNDGMKNGKRLLPEHWVKYSTTPTATFLKMRKDWKNGSIGGASWWLNRHLPELQETRPWPSAPEDTFLAQGHWGQVIAVIPSLKVVAVRLGDTRDRSFSNDIFLKQVIRLIQSEGALK